MKTMPKAAMSGGCQCGAVRYALDAPPSGASICHCRMCQKASGNYFQAFVGVPRGKLRWVRGTPGSFRSSALVEREFCRDCGTPLTYRPVDEEKVWVTVGSLDRPERAQPAQQYGLESRIVDFHALAVLPGKTTAQVMGPERLARLGSLQHPDHD